MCNVDTPSLIRRTRLSEVVHGHEGLLAHFGKRLRNSNCEYTYSLYCACKSLLAKGSPCMTWTGESCCGSTGSQVVRLAKSIVVDYLFAWSQILVTCETCRSCRTKSHLCLDSEPLQVKAARQIWASNIMACNARRYQSTETSCKRMLQRHAGKIENHMMA